MSKTAPRVLLSYSHDSPEHETRVLDLADRLRADGIDARLDQYERWPTEGWTLWMEHQIRDADFVVLICTETYRRRVDGDEDPGRGLGVCWEGRLIRNLSYEARGSSERYLPALPPDGRAEHIPLWLRDLPRFDAFDDLGYEQLYRHLTNQPTVSAPELGLLRKLPPAPRRERHAAFRAAPTWVVPHEPNPFFTGRENVLRELRSELQRSGRVALCGMGGMGKTETARRYAYLHRDAYPTVFWTSAASRDDLLSGYQVLARELALPLANDPDIEVVAKAVLRWLDTHDDWLLILDNADEPEALAGLLPTRGRGHLLITMRPLFAGKLATKVEITSLSDDEGALFLLRRANRIKGEQDLSAVSDAERNAALAVCEQVGGLPLALDQAGAYLDGTGAGPERYLVLLRENKPTLLARRGDDEAEHASVSVTFRVAHQMLAERNALAADLLRLCAFLAPDAIPEELFELGAAALDEPLRSALSDELSRDAIVRDARQLALLDRDVDTRSLTVHRIVQDVIREELSEAERQCWVRRAIEMVVTAFPTEPEFRNWPLCERLLPHALTASTWIERWSLEDATSARLLHLTGWYFGDRARFDEAEGFFRRAVTMREVIHGPAHADTAQSLNDLACVLQRQGRFAEAGRVFQQALDIREPLLGSEHVDFAQSLANLGSLFREQGKYVEAEPPLRRALKIREQALGPTHRDTAFSLNSLGSLLRDQGKLAEAEPLIRRTLRIREPVLGPDHPDTAVALNNLAQLLRDQGKLAEAEPLWRRALQIAEQALGPDHPTTAVALNNLAQLLRDQGKLAEAEPLLRQALQITQQALGPEHPDTARVLNNLASVIGTRGKPDQAERYLRRAVLVAEEALGPDHPDVGGYVLNLAGVLGRLGRMKEARLLEKRGRTILEKHARENAL